MQLDNAGSAAPFRLANWRLLAVVGVLLFIALFVGFGGFGWVTDADNIEEFLAESGVIGPIAFILIVWIGRPLGIPMPVFMIAAAAVWPASLAILIYWIGHVGACFISFRAARGLARSWVEPRIPARLRRFDDRLADSGVRSVIVARLATRLFALDWLLGVSAVSSRAFLLGTAIGVLPSIVLFILASDGILEVISSAPVGVQVALVTVVVGFLGRRLVLSRLSTDSPVFPDLRLDIADDAGLGP